MWDGTVRFAGPHRHDLQTFYPGAFAFHWHNQYDAPIAPTSPFQQLLRVLQQCTPDPDFYNASQRRDARAAPVAAAQCEPLRRRPRTDPGPSARGPRSDGVSVYKAVAPQKGAWALGLGAIAMVVLLGRRPSGRTC